MSINSPVEETIQSFEVVRYFYSGVSNLNNTTSWPYTYVNSIGICSCWQVYIYTSTKAKLLKKRINKRSSST